jgi:hypothetical protein
MFFINWKDQTMNEIDSQYRALHEIVCLYIKYHISVLFSE